MKKRKAESIAVAILVIGIFIGVSITLAHQMVLPDTVTSTATSTLSAKATSIATHFDECISKGGIYNLDYKGSPRNLHWSFGPDETKNLDTEACNYPASETKY